MSEPVVPKRRVVRRNTTASSRASSSAPVASAVTLTVLPPKPKVVRRKKDATPVPQQLQQQTKQSVVHQLSDKIITKIPESENLIETMDTQIEVTEVKHMHLRTVIHEGIAYWKDEHDLLYTKTADGKRGALVN